MRQTIAVDRKYKTEGIKRQKAGGVMKDNAWLLLFFFTLFRIQISSGWFGKKVPGSRNGRVGTSRAEWALVQRRVPVLTENLGLSSEMSYDNHLSVLQG